MTIKDIITHLNEFASRLQTGVDTPVDMINVVDINGMNTIIYPNQNEDSCVDVSFDKNTNSLIFKAKPDNNYV